MKKLLLLMAGAIVALAANAQEQASDWAGKYVSFQIGDDAGTDKTPNEVTSGNWGSCTWTNLEIGTDGFLIKYYDTDAQQNHWYGGKTVTADGSSYTTLDETTTKAYVSGATAGQKYNVTFYLNAKSIMLEPVSGSTSGFEDFWLVGGFNEWSSNDSYKFSTTDGTNYTLALPAEIASGGEFKINNGAWHDDGGVELAGTFDKLGEPFDVGYLANVNITTGSALPQGTVFKLVYNGNGTGTLTIGSVVSGIRSVAVDADAAAGYYTVSGIRVTGDPAPGIYLRRQCGKVEKVVIR